jgi:DNA repair protein RadA/Sms
VFVNLVGGVKTTETSTDLASLAAIVSSLRGIALPQDLVLFGEVGLSGEIRPVPSGQERIQEALKHGFKRAIIPYGNKPRQDIQGMDVVLIKKLPDLLSALF